MVEAPFKTVFRVSRQMCIAQEATQALGCNMLDRRSMCLTMN